MINLLKNRKAQLIFLQFFLIALLLSAEVTVTYMAKKNAAGIEAKGIVKEVIIGGMQELEGKSVFYDNLVRESIRSYTLYELGESCDPARDIYTISELFTRLDYNKPAMKEAVNGFITEYNSKFATVLYGVPWASDIFVRELTDSVEIIVLFDQEQDPAALEIRRTGVTVETPESMTIVVRNPMNYCDPDGDNDGIYWQDDNCPSNYNLDQTNHDGDGKGDACDPDIDNDGVLNEPDQCDYTTLGKTVSEDGCTDSDGDGLSDSNDNCPAVSNSAQTDTDGDGLGDACDDDDDGDGVLDSTDSCSGTVEGTNVADDGCEDSDNDGTSDSNDNCPDNYNENQADMDGDGFGDACDPDIDDDGVNN
ncbi:MAG: thrombospondin type 3 repeat-containing protein, partial [archaeon]|nr:thrombospondin type 3 repeat-containing protein [archaeon]